MSESSGAWAGSLQLWYCTSSMISSPSHDPGWIALIHLVSILEKL